MVSVRLKGVYKRYLGGVIVVFDFNLDIEDKEFIVLVGLFGCGKIIIFRMIVGFEEVIEGEIYIGDKLVNDVLLKDRDIVMVFQNYVLYFYMIVFENMVFGFKFRKFLKDEIKRCVYEVVKILGIEYLFDRKLKVLFGGQRQRVVLGCVIVRELKVFFMDEFFLNLDVKFRVQMRVELFKFYKRFGIIFIYVIYD